MTNPKTNGNRSQITVYLEKDEFDKIEIQRGGQSRNQFLAGLIKTALS